MNIRRQEKLESFKGTLIDVMNISYWQNRTILHDAVQDGDNCVLMMYRVNNEGIIVSKRDIWIKYARGYWQQDENNETIWLIESRRFRKLKDNTGRIYANIHVYADEHNFKVDYVRKMMAPSSKSKNLYGLEWVPPEIVKENTGN